MMASLFDQMELKQFIMRFSERKWTPFVRQYSEHRWKRNVRWTYSIWVGQQHLINPQGRKRCTWKHLDPILGIFVASVMNKSELEQILTWWISSQIWRIGAYSKRSRKRIFLVQLNRLLVRIKWASSVAAFEIPALFPWNTTQFHRTGKKLQPARSRAISKRWWKIESNKL